MPKVSVIVPIYGVEDYIECCVESLFRQTLEDMEFIFVDDCSKDNSISVLKTVLQRFPQRQSQVLIVTHEKNLGLPQARRTGLKYASGHYVAHCDSDDWVDDDMYAEMYERALATDSDMIVCDYMNVYDDYTRVSDPCYTKEYLQALLLCRCTGSLCNRITRREIFLDDGFRFPERTYCEDYVCSVQLALYSSRIEYIPRPFYKYRHRVGSIVMTKDRVAIDKRILDNLINHKLVESIISDHGLSEKYFSELIALRLIVKNSIRFYMDHRGYYKLWRQTYPDLTISIFKSKHISWRTRFAYFITYIGLYPIFMKLKEKCQK